MIEVTWKKLRSSERAEINNIAIDVWQFMTDNGLVARFTIFNMNTKHYLDSGEKATVALAKEEIDKWI